MTCCNEVPLTQVGAARVTGEPTGSVRVTVEVGTKPLPLRVSVNEAAFLPAAVGLMAVSAGAGLVTVNAAPLGLQPPPGGGLTTVSVWFAPEAVRVASATALRWAASTKVVESFAPSSTACEVEMKLPPVTAMVTGPPPAVAEVGLSDATDGTGLTMVSVAGGLSPPPGASLTTTRDGVPRALVTEFGSAALSCPAPTNVLARAAPLRVTCEVVTNPEPAMVRRTLVLPTTTREGTSVSAPGTGLLTARGRVPLVPPPGPGLTTFTA